MSNSKKFKAIIIGASAGGLDAISKILSEIKDVSIPVIIVQHFPDTIDCSLVDYFSKINGVKIEEANDKHSINQSTVYIAPAGYHLLIEEDATFSLSKDDKVCYARPSIDVTFESGALAYGENLIGILLTGANSDGTNGLKYIKKLGGHVVIQNPKTAEVSFMPENASLNVESDAILDLEQIPDYIKNNLRVSSYNSGSSNG